MWKKKVEWLAFFMNLHFIHEIHYEWNKSCRTLNSSKCLLYCSYNKRWIDEREIQITRKCFHCKRAFIFIHFSSQSKCDRIQKLNMKGYSDSNDDETSTQDLKKKERDGYVFQGWMLL